MDAASLITNLERFPDALEAVLGRLSAADWRWRPPEGGWSALEVVGHLVDEETDDFGARLRLTLTDPALAWPSMDPEAWVVERRYQDRDPAATLRRFRDERARSVAWLRSLRSPNWDAAHAHPRSPTGFFSAGDLLASWASHDPRHLVQIAKRLHAMAVRDGAPYSTTYAG